MCACACVWWEKREREKTRPDTAHSTLSQKEKESLRRVQNEQCQAGWPVSVKNDGQDAQYCTS